MDHIGFTIINIGNGDILQYRSMMLRGYKRIHDKNVLKQCINRALPYGDDWSFVKKYDRCYITVNKIPAAMKMISGELYCLSSVYYKSYLIDTVYKSRSPELIYASIKATAPTVSPVCVYDSVCVDVISLCAIFNNASDTDITSCILFHITIYNEIMNDRIPMEFVDRIMKSMRYFKHAMHNISYISLMYKDIFDNVLPIIKSTTYNHYPVIDDG